MHYEGIGVNKIFLVGDVMYDAAVYYGARTRSDTLSKLGVTSKGYVLATIHRAENTDAGPRLRSVFAGLSPRWPPEFGARSLSHRWTR